MTNSVDIEKAIQFQLDNSNLAPTRLFYHEQSIYDLELKNIMFKSWHFAGHTSQVPLPGDYFQYKIADESIIIIRQDDQSISALINSCRHRGSRVCEHNSGNLGAFSCPYHGWVYAKDGSLRGAREMNDCPGFNKSKLGLKQIKVAERFGLIFINFDNHAEDYEPHLKKLDKQFKPYHLDKAKIAKRNVYSVDANWKVALGNYLECYHCETAHKLYSKIHSFKEREHKVSELNRAMWERSFRETNVEHLEKAHYQIFREAPSFGACVYTSRYALYPDYLTGSLNGQALAPFMGDFKGYDGGAGDFQFGPLCYMLNYPDHCILFRYVPFGMDKTDMEIIWFVNENAEEGVDYDVDKLTQVWHETTLEDKRIISLNAAGIKSHFFEPGPQHHEFEDTPMRFFDWYFHALAGDFSVREASERSHRTSSIEKSIK